MNEKSKSSPASQNSKVSARRRLIRGAFSAPALLTIYSGSAMATSSPLRCVINQNATPVHPTALTSAPAQSERYARVRVFQGSVDSLFYVKGYDISLHVKKGVTPYIATNQVQQITPDSVPGTFRAPKTFPSTSIGSLNGVNRWVALRIDPTGKIIGVVGGGNGGSAIANSCWTSFGTGA